MTTERSAVSVSVLFWEMLQLHNSGKITARINKTQQPNLNFFITTSKKLFTYIWREDAVALYRKGKYF
jgi:hypothetical protein